MVPHVPLTRTETFVLLAAHGQKEHAQHEQHNGHDTVEDSAGKIARAQRRQQTDSERVRQTHQTPRLAVRDVLGLKIAHCGTRLALRTTCKRVIRVMMDAMVHEQHHAQQQQAES